MLSLAHRIVVAVVALCQIYPAAAFFRLGPGTLVQERVVSRLVLSSVESRALCTDSSFEGSDCLAVSRQYCEWVNLMMTLTDAYPTRLVERPVGMVRDSCQAYS